MKKTWTEVPAGIINGASNRFWVALGNNAETVATRINTDPGFVDKLAKFAEEHCVSKTPSWERAREIMGKNFFGVDEAIQYLGINPKGKLGGLCYIPWSEEVLMSVKDTHILAAVLKKGESEWHLVCKTAVKDSTSKTWLEQQELLRGSEQVPTTEVARYVVNGYFKLTGERMFEGMPVRTSSLSLADHHCIAGMVADNEFYHDERPYPRLGLASELKKP